MQQIILEFNPAGAVLFRFYQNTKDGLILIQPLFSIEKNKSSIASRLNLMETEWPVMKDVFKYHSDKKSLIF